MSYDVNWLKNNMHPVIVSGLGCCSACCLRNLDKQIFCDKLQCHDGWTGGAVYWESIFPGFNYDFLIGQLNSQMVEWFNKTPIDLSRRISGEMVKKAIQNNMAK